MQTTPSINSANFRSGIASQRRMNSSLVNRSPSRNGGSNTDAATDIGWGLPEVNFRLALATVPQFAGWCV